MVLNITRSNTWNSLVIFVLSNYFAKLYLVHSSNAKEIFLPKEGFRERKKHWKWHFFHFFTNGFSIFCHLHLNEKKGSVKINKAINESMKKNEYRFCRSEISVYVLILLLLNGEKRLKFETRCVVHKLH